jgi:hypothetical protein
VKEETNRIENSNQRPQEEKDQLVNENQEVKEETN